MENFLSEAGALGEHNSTGSFKISYQEALRKLRDFQLPRRGAFIANLVSAVVLGEGSFLQLSTTDSSLSFLFDGPLLNRHDLDSLFYSPFQPEAPLWRKELAIAANGTLGLPLNFLSFESWNHEQKSGWQMKHSRGEESTAQALSRPLGEGPLSRLSLHFGYKRGFKIEPYLESVLTELKSRCVHAPIQIRYRRKSYTRAPISKRAEIAQRVWRSRDTGPALTLRGQALEADELVHDEPFTAHLTIVPTDQGRVDLVVNGVSFSPPPGTFSLPDWAKLVVAVPHLKKDLSQDSLSEDDSIRQLSSWASKQVLPLLEHTCQSFPSLASARLKHFNACLEESFGEFPPDSVAEWFEHQDMVQRARSPEELDGLLTELKELNNDERTQEVWRVAARLQWAELREAWSKQTWEDLLPIVQNLRTIAARSSPLSETEEETIQAALYLAGEKVQSLRNPEKPEDIPWQQARQAVLAWLNGNPEEAYQRTFLVSGFWGHYLRFQLLLPDLEQARDHLNTALNSAPRALFALADLTDMEFLAERPKEALQLRQAFMQRKPPASAFWAQQIRREARRHGSISQFAYWTARTGLEEILRDGDTVRSVVDKLASYTKSDWGTLLEKSKTVKLTNAKWRFLTHRALWSLRKQGDWDLARHHLFQRLLLSSFTESGSTPQEPAFSKF